MCSIYGIQFFVYSMCIYLFTLFTYFTYYGDLLLTSYKSEPTYTYDYIIVGSGTAGSLIAHRISTETNYTYIVLEAGAQSNPLLDIPVIGPLLHGSVYDWQYETVPQVGACLSMKNKQCKLTQGKIAGGSAKLNNMIHIRGNISQYKDWFQGKHTYNFIKKQFEYIEKEILPVDNVQYQSDLSTATMEAAKELGYDILDLNKNFKSGFMSSKVNQKASQRWSTFHTFSMNNHRIITNAHVEKVLINKKNIAYGVRYWKLGKEYKVYAKKGVIVSAGTLNTPKILQLSGVGPTDVLNKYNIDVIKDLPVGKNLQDHITTGLDLILFNNSLNFDGSNLLNPLYMYQYFLQGQGPLTSPGCEIVGFLQTKKGLTNPNIQFMVLPIGLTADRGSHLRKSLGIDDVTWNNYFVKSFDKHTASMLPILLHPKSKGEVLIRSNNFKSPPLIDPKYLSIQEDVDTLVEGLEIIFQFLKTKSMINLGAYANENIFPGCQELKLFSKSYWQCYVRHLTLTSFHPVGTCSMGSPYVNFSVVNTSFKVIGIDKLFVADGSVLPELPSGNVNAAIAMMASIFFETNIARRKRINPNNYCSKSDYLHEYIFQICVQKYE